MTEKTLDNLVSLAQELEASLDKTGALVRIEPSGKVLGHHIVANESGMLALGVECLKASVRPSINSEVDLPLLTQSLSYLAGGYGERINGLFVDNGIKYERRPTQKELDEEDSGISFSNLLFNLLIWGTVGFAGLGFFVSVRWLWNTVS